MTFSEVTVPMGALKGSHVVQTEKWSIEATEVNVGPIMTDVQRSALEELLNKLRERFAMLPSEL